MCDSNTDDCRNVYCENGGTCIDGANAYSCSCPSGYAGEHCEVIVDECASNLCVNSLNCTNLVSLKLNK